MPDNPLTEEEILEQTRRKNAEAARKALADFSPMWAQGGRNVIYLQKEEPITETNIIQILNDAKAYHLANVRAIDYLQNYMKGVQPILRRIKDVRPNINNRIVENHAHEIVSFKVGYEFGQPIQYVQHGRFHEPEGNQEQDDEYIVWLNKMMFEQEKQAKDIAVGEDMAICGVGYRMPYVINESDLESPFGIMELDPKTTLVIRSNEGNKPVVCAVSYSVNHDKEMNIVAYTKTNKFTLTGKYLFQGLAVTNTDPNTLGLIPIVEYVNNRSRLGSFEIVLPLLDALNKATSDRLNDIEQFVQALLWFSNCEIDEGGLTELLELGLVQTKSTPSFDAKVSYLTQNLNQAETQVLIDNLYEKILTIAGVPDRMSNVNRNTGQAVMLASGWSIAESHARAKEPLFAQSEKEMLRVIFKILRLAGKPCGFSENFKLSDIEIKFTRNRNENLLVKTQGLVQLLESGIHPRIAITSVDLFSDPEMVYEESKEFIGQMQNKKNETPTMPTPAQDVQVDL